MAKRIILPAENIPETAAALVTDIADEMLETQSLVVLGICGGKSISGILAKLSAQRTDWNRIHFFFVDERTDGANYKQAKKLLFDKLRRKLPKANIHQIRFDAEKDDFGAEDYGKELEKFGGRFDIIILSAGEDGHVASLFPEHESAEEEAEYFIPVRNAPKEPKERISASMSLLGRSKSAILLFLGEGKRNAYRRFIGNEDEILCPAKVVDWIKEAYAITDIR